MLLDILFAMGLILSPSTQLRLGGLPIGPGELCILSWLFWLFFARIIRLRELKARTSAGWPIAAFAIVLAISESAGLIVGMATELFYDVPAVLHDVFAYSFMIATGLMLCTELSGDKRRAQIVRFALWFGSFSIIMQHLHGSGIINVPGLDPWHFDRLRGWSHDPNQLGFLAAFMTFLALYLHSISGHAVERISVLCCLSLAVFVGFESKSDTFVFSAGSAGLVYALMMVRRAIVRGTGSMQAAALKITLIGVPLCLLSSLPFFPTLMRSAEVYSEQVYNKDHQGDTRLSLWQEALSKSLQSGLVGFGPGPHLTSKSYKRPPPDKFESHNTALELMTQGGLFASIGFVALMTIALAATIGANLPPLAALVSGFIVFSQFHFVLRQPIFWFGLTLSLIESARAQQATHIPAMQHSVLAVLRHRWKSVAAAAVLGSAVSLSIGLLVTKRYTADARVLLEATDRDALDDLFTETVIMLVGSEGHLTRVMRTLASPDALDKVDTGVSESTRLAAASISRHELSSNMNAFRDERSRVVDITFTADDPEVAKLVADVSAEVLVAEDQERRASDLNRAWEERAQRTSRFRADVGNLERFAAGNFDLHGGGAAKPTSALNQLAVLTRQLELATSTLGLRASKANSEGLTNDQQSSIESDRAPSDAQSQDPSHARSGRALIGNRNAQRRRGDLPDLEKTALEIRQRSIANQLESLHAAYEALADSEAADRYMLRRAREVVATYEQLLQHQGDSLLENKSKSVLHLISRAQMPEGPSSAPAILYIPPGLLFTSLVGVLIIFARRRLDRTIGSQRQIRNRFGIPCVSADAGPVRTRGLRARDSIEAIFPLIGAGATSNPRQAKVVAITSSIAGEGKSSVAIALADCAARSLRVLLFDVNCRDASHLPRLGLGPASQSLEIEAIPGRRVDVTSWCLGNVDRLLVDGEYALRSFIDSVRSDYDLVVIDTPSMLVAPEACVPCRVADAVLFVVRANVTCMEQAEHGFHQLAITVGGKDKRVVAVLTGHSEQFSQWHHDDLIGQASGSPPSAPTRSLR